MGMGNLLPILSPFLPDILEFLTLLQWTQGLKSAVVLKDAIHV